MHEFIGERLGIFPQEIISKEENILSPLRLLISSSSRKIMTASSSHHTMTKIKERGKRVM